MRTGGALTESRTAPPHSGKAGLFGGLGPGTKAALLTLFVGAACLILAPYAPWITAWPKTLTLPATEWIGVVLTGLLEWIRPFARLCSAQLDYPMRWRWQRKGCVPSGGSPV